MPRFAIGDPVLCLYNPPTPTTPQQTGDHGEYIGGRDRNGQRLFKDEDGPGGYQCGQPPEGVIVEVRETAAGTQYLVRVRLKVRVETPYGAHTVESTRHRVIDEHKLSGLRDPLPPPLAAWIAKHP